MDENQEEEFEFIVAVSLKKKKYALKYSKDDLENALSEILNGRSVCAASKGFNVPQATLWSRLKPSNTVSPGRKTVLDSETEKQIVDWAIEYTQMGDPRTKLDLKLAARDLSLLNTDQTRRFSSQDGMPTSKWLTGFLKPNSRVTFRTPEAISRASANVSEDDNRRFFNNFSSRLEKNNFQRPN